MLVGAGHPLVPALVARLGASCQTMAYAPPTSAPRAAALVLLPPPWPQEPADVVAVIDDLDVAYRWLHAWVPYVREQGSGVLLYVLDLDGIYGDEGRPLLAERDSALLAQARAMALELGRMGVRSNALALGPLAVAPPAATDPEAPPDARAANPLRRVGTWGEAAEVAAFLLSDAAVHLSGQLLVCAGGADVGRAPL